MISISILSIEIYIYSIKCDSIKYRIAYASREVFHEILFQYLKFKLDFHETKYFALYFQTDMLCSSLQRYDRDFNWQRLGQILLLFQSQNSYLLIFSLHEKIETVQNCTEMMISISIWQQIVWKSVFNQNNVNINCSESCISI